MLPDIPAFQPLPAASLDALAALPAGERTKLLAAVQAALANLAHHTDQWTRVKAMLEEDRA
jgi:hypothetical protein